MLNPLIHRIQKKYHVEFLYPFGLMIISKEDQMKEFTQILSANEVTNLVSQHQLVILRNFKNSISFVEYAKSIGPLLQWEFGEVMEMKVRDNLENYLFSNSHVPFHWDGAFHQEPRYLLFNCIEAPRKNSGGETLFTNTHLIWEDANILDKERWSQLQMTYRTEKIVHYGGEITVPMIQKHFDTNKTIIRFAEPVPNTLKNPVEVEVSRLQKQESVDFIHHFAKRCYESRYCYTHSWNQNDFIIADNFSLLHARNAFTQFTPRHLRRIQIL